MSATASTMSFETWPSSPWASMGPISLRDVSGPDQLDSCFEIRAGGLGAKFHSGSVFR